MCFRKEYNFSKRCKQAFIGLCLMSIILIFFFVSRFDGRLRNNYKHRATRGPKTSSVQETSSSVAVLVRNNYKHRATRGPKTSSVQETSSSVLVRENKTKKVLPTLVKKISAVNLDVDRSKFCSEKYNYGEMCPKLYSELGRCEYKNAKLNCPDVRSKVKEVHRQTQIIFTRILRVFHLVAEKHGIRYWLTSGTLLGAARHKANLPWDTDADINMPLEDYIKFFKHAAKDLPDDIFFQNSISDPALRPSDPADAARITHKEVGIYRRTWNPRLRDEKSCYKYCIAHNCAWHDGIMIDMFILDGKVGQEYFPLKKMEFEGFLFNVPANWEELLKDLYGTRYMELPPKDKRRPVDFPDNTHSCKELKANL